MFKVVVVLLMVLPGVRKSSVDHSQRTTVPENGASDKVMLPPEQMLVLPPSTPVVGAPLTFKVRVYTTVEFDKSLGIPPNSTK